MSRLGLIISGLRKNVTSATPARVLNTTFQPSASRPTLVIYTVRIEQPASIATPQQARIELRSDAADPPVTVRCQTRQARGTPTDATLAHDAVLVHLVPAGHRVRLENVTVSGTPTFTLVNQTEISL